MKTKHKQLFLAIFIYFLGSLLFTFWIYQSTYRNHRQAIDEKLKVAAHATDELLGQDYHAGLIDRSSISRDKERETISLLNRFVEEINVVYLYTLILEDNNVLFASSSQTEEEMARKETVYFDPYDDANAAVYTAFETGKTQFAEYTDQWGEFRSIFIPMVASDGRQYVAGADISIQQIKALSSSSALKALLAWLFFGLIVLPMIWNYIRSVLREAQLEIERLYHDPLTGLPNRYKLIDDLKTSRHPKLAILSFDKFHEVNAAYGVAVGDQVLIRFAQRLQDLTHPQIESHSVYRLHGDTFGFLVDQSISYNDTKRVLLKLLDDLSQHFYVGHTEIKLTITIGAVTNVSDPLELAEMAFFKACETNQQIITYDNEVLLPEIYQQTIESTTNLQQAIDEKRLVPYFMPIVNIKSGEVEKHECLARIIDENGTVIGMPDEFLPLAHRAKLYPLITRTILNHAIEMIRETRQRLTLNISTTDINDPRTNQYLLRRIKATETGPYLDIEILETEHIDDYDTTKLFFQRLKSIGCRIGIDDLGRDYSNYERLINLPFDFIKIDRTIIEHIEEHPEASRLTRELLKLASEHQMETIAEYCYSQDILDIVKELGFDCAQGTHIGAAASQPVLSTNNNLKLTSHG